MKRENMMSPLEVGKIIGTSQDMIKAALRTNQLPFGMAIYNKETDRWRYLIPRQAFERWMQEGGPEKKWDVLEECAR